MRQAIRGATVRSPSFTWASTWVPSSVISVCGTLAAVYGWHYAFAAAGVGMLLGLSVYVFGQRYLATENAHTLHKTDGTAKQPLDVW